MAGTKVPAKLNREASRLGDVRVRRPSSRAQVPETCRDQLIASVLKMDFCAQFHQQEYLLARLQKPQLSEKSLLRSVS